MLVGYVRVSKADGSLAERTRAGLASARARGRHGGRPYKMTPAKLRLAMTAMGQPETHIGACVPSWACRAGHSIAMSIPKGRCERTARSSWPRADCPKE